MVRQYVGAAKFISNLLKGGKQKTTGTEVVNVVKPGTRLAKKRSIQDKVISDRDKMMGGLSKEGKVDVRTKSNQPKINKKMSDILESKAKGGRVGLKRGTGLMKKKSNVEKIKKTFGPKSLGMQSVIYGLDKNPKITAADPKAKFIAAANKKKKRTMAMGGGFMGRRMGYSSGTDPKMIEGVSEAKEKRILKSKRKP